MTNRVTPLWYNIDITETRTKGNKMNYQPYTVRMTKDTPTGMRYLVRCNHTNKWAICSWVGSTGAAIGNPECQGKYEYVMKKWHKLVGKYVRMT